MSRKRKKNDKANRMSTSQPSMDKKGIRNSVWNFNKESERESKTITLDEYMDFMRKFLNRLYPQPGYRVTAMTYMKDAIYMKINKDTQTSIEDAEWTI